MSDSAFAAGGPIPGLSSWLLERRLGGGGFGEVWLARHAWNPKEPPRAVKFCTHPEVRHRLATHEKNVVLRVMRHAGGHPNIVPLVDCNLDGDLPWLMYEYVEGGTLAALMDQWRELPLPKRLGRAVRTLAALAGALARCHRLSPPLVHRDMKPANVLMAGGKVPKITDFGIGSVVLPAGADAGGLTALGAKMPTMMTGTGTRLYAPPEQLLGGPPSPREDVYALGVMAYQLITGDPAASPGADAEDELRARKVPAELARLVVRSVSLNADRRPKDAAEWEAVLGALLRKSQKPGESADSAAEIEAISPPSAPGPDLPPLLPAEWAKAVGGRDPRRLTVAACCAGVALVIGAVALLSIRLLR